MDDVLIGEIKQGYGHSKTGNKQQKREFYGIALHFRITLSFLLSMSDILCFAKSDIALRVVILFGFAS